MFFDSNVATGQLRLRDDGPQWGYRVSLDGDGLDQRQLFYLLPEYTDSGKLAEKFSIDLRTALSQRVPWADYVHVSVNGVSQGLFLDMRKIRIQTFAEFGWELDSHFFQCGDNNCEMKIAAPGPYQTDFESGDDQNASKQPAMAALLQFINRTDDDDFESQLPEKIDLDAYLGYLASNALMSETVVEDTKGWWIRRPSNNIWEFVPWELDHTHLLWNRTADLSAAPKVDEDLRTFTVFDPAIQKTYNSRVKTLPDYQPTWSVLNTRIWRRPALREAILEKIEAAMNDGPFAETAADAHLDALSTLVASTLEADPYLDSAHAAVAMEFYKSYVTGRAASLRTQIDQLRASTPSLVINEIGVGDASNPGYVELYNPGSTAYSLGGLTITDDLRLVTKQTLSQELSVPAGGFLALIADGNVDLGPDHLAFTISSTGGEVGLFDGVHVYGPIDLMYFGSHAAGTAYGRIPDGSDAYRPLRQTPGSKNHK
jgi:spore coat protein H